MKTLEQIKQYEFEALDGRDKTRLLDFIPVSEWKDYGVELKEGVTPADIKHNVIEYNRENVLRQLEKDVAFGFQKALDQRGISAGLMYGVVQMWNWVLEEGLENFDDYAQYGLPLFKATAEKYGFDNPIGADTGKELKYAA